MFSLAACGDSAKDSGNAGTDGSAEATTEGDASGDELNVCLASEPATLDPALNSAVDGGTVVLHLFSGLTKWEKSGDGLEIVHDGIKDATKTENEDGTVTYT